MFFLASPQPASSVNTNFSFLQAFLFIYFLSLQHIIFTIHTNGYLPPTSSPQFLSQLSSSHQPLRHSSHSPLPLATLCESLAQPPSSAVQPDSIEDSLASFQEMFPTPDHAVTNPYNNTQQVNPASTTPENHQMTPEQRDCAEASFQQAYHLQEKRIARENENRKQAI